MKDSFHPATGRWLFCCFALAMLTLPLLLGGCAVLGIAAQALPQQTVPAAYRGFEHQSVAVMVWADRGIDIDFPSAELDTATGVHRAMSTATARELEESEWPVDPRSIVQYQRDHPHIEMLPITDVAPAFGVTRLIYIEIESLQTRSDYALELFRGSMTGTLKVIEIEPDGSATVAFEENDITAVFPRGVPPEGIPAGNDYRMYLGTLEAFTAEVVKRFVRHEAER